MKRRFKSDSDLEDAAKRRGFSLQEGVTPPPKPTPPPVQPPFVPTPQPKIDTAPIADAIRETAQATAMAMQQVSQQNIAVSSALEQRLVALSANVGRPLRWKVTVSGRDYDGRITEMDIQAVPENQDE